MSRLLQVDFLLAGLRDSSGRSLAGGKVFTYQAGTSTLVSLFGDVAGTITLTNPLILDSRGAGEAWGNGSYKFVIKDSADVIQYTWDNKNYSTPADSSIYAGTSTGASNVYAVTPSPAISALSDGDTVTFIANHASIVASGTLNVSGLGARSFVRVDGTTAIGSGDIVVSQLVDARYVLASNHFRLVSQAGVAAIASGGTGSSTASGARANLGLGTISTQNAIAVTVTTLTAGTVTGDTGVPLVLKSVVGQEIQIYEGASHKVSIASGTTSGSCLFLPQINNNYVLGTTSFNFKDINTYKVTYKTPTNFNNASFAYTERTSLNPAVATASNVADYVLTLVQKLGLNNGVSFTP